MRLTTMVPSRTAICLTAVSSVFQRCAFGFAIPPDEVDNFDQAVADGRAVVLYPDAGADAQAVVTAFRAAGLRNVRSY